MNIPSSVRVGAHDVSVVFCDGLKTDEGGDALGLQKTWANRIEMVRGFRGDRLPESRAAHLFLHELIHFLSETYGIGLDEDQTEGVAGSLLAVIRDNDLDFRA